MLRIWNEKIPHPTHFILWIFPWRNWDKKYPLAPTFFLIHEKFIRIMSISWLFFVLARTSLFLPASSTYALTFRLSHFLFWFPSSRSCWFSRFCLFFIIRNDFHIFSPSNRRTRKYELFSSSFPVVLELQLCFRVGFDIIVVSKFVTRFFVSLFALLVIPTQLVSLPA